MAKDALPLITPLALTALIFFLFGVEFGGYVFLGLSLFVAFFFRDPERMVSPDKAAIVSPADGKIVRVSAEKDGTTRVSIFLSLFNVHINRSPIAGKVEMVTYHPGKFKVALDARASVENEQNVLIIGNGSHHIKFSQIAGILARRIVCWKKEGDRVEKGERIGLIKFGSRVDIFLPRDVALAVNLGDKVKGGSTIIGRFIHV
jgi:phosphatidylserine decarboxylase